jgi:hypothetical protein
MGTKVVAKTTPRTLKLYALGNGMCVKNLLAAQWTR